MSQSTMRVSVLVPSVDRASILVEVAEHGGLPTFDLESTDDDAAVMIVQRLLRERLGVAPPVLETHLPIDPVRPGGAEILEMLAILEPVEAGWLPPSGFAWYALAGPPPAVPARISPRLHAWLDEWRTGASPPPLRPAWSRPGWHSRATAWMETMLDRAGRTVDGPIEVRRLWGISALLRAPTTDGGAVWLKAVFPRFGHEPAVTEFLELAVPGSVPHVIAVEPDEGWLLLDEVGEPSSPRADDAVLEEIRALVRVQRELLGREAELEALGCPRRPLSELADELAWATGGTPPLPGVDLAPARLDQLVAWVRDQAERIGSFDLPDVVVHGDFHPGNVLSGPDGLLIIDWSDAAIANPLMDVGPLLGYVEDSELGPRCWATWLDALAPLGAVEALRGESSAVIGLAVAFQIVSLGHIMGDLEPANRYQLGDDLYAFLGTLDAHVPR